MLIFCEYEFIDPSLGNFGESKILQNLHLEPQNLSKVEHFDINESLHFLPTLFQNFYYSDKLQIKVMLQNIHPLLINIL